MALVLNTVAQGTPMSVLCYNLPANSSCSYSSASHAVTITTVSSTPSGHYQVLIVCNTNPSQVASAHSALALRTGFYAVLMLPFGLFSLGAGRRKKVIFLIVLLGVLVISMVACGGGNSTKATTPVNTASAQASATINLTVN